MTYQIDDLIVERIVTMRRNGFSWLEISRKSALSIVVCHHIYLEWQAARARAELEVLT